MTTWFISRHPGAIAWASEQGLCIDQHLNHLDTKKLQPGDTIIGTLPVHLAAAVCKQGARFINLSLDLPEHWRGQELSAEELRKCNARLECFNITYAKSEGEVT